MERTMIQLQAKKTGLLLASLLAIAACKNDSSNNNNGGPGDAGVICTAGTKECLDGKHARVCSKEGAEWYVVTCDTNETCDKGDCTPDEVVTPPVILCYPGDGKCMPGNPDQSLICKADGQGYTATACPAGTACVGAGVCVGVCAVGSSICLDGKTLATCQDGTGYTTTTCAANQGCVATGSSPFDTAACKASDCLPSADGCDFVCGNKVDTNADQTKFVSVCIETPDGWKWTALGCGADEICDAQGGALCAGGLKAQAACASECTTGDSMCDENGLKVTCVAGKWGTPTACADNKACFADRANPNKALCGDAVCAISDGTCTADGKLLACDATGNLATEGTACASGVCTQVGAYLGGLPPSKCVDLCKSGASECVGDLGYSITSKLCENGRWTKLSNCTTGFCFPAADVDGHTATQCGECNPGWGECGAVDGDGRRPMRTCGADAKWQDYQNCTLGSCEPSGDYAYCVADCMPGDKICAGSLVTSNATNPAGYRAYTQVQVCDAFGLFSTAPTTCGTGTMCRTDIGGAVLGCVECVYNNEYGLVDSQCRNDFASIRFCTAANTWGTTTDCGASMACDPPLGPDFQLPIVYVAPAPTDRVYCHGCEYDTNASLEECTATALEAQGYTCGDVFGSSGTVSCGSRTSATATVGDCCATACSQDSTNNLPLPAGCYPD